MNSQSSFNTEKNLSASRLSEREKGRFSEVDELGCAFWCNFAEIELDVDLVQEREDVCIGVDLKIKE